MLFISEIEAVTATSVFQRVRAVNKKRSVNKTLCVLFAHQKSSISGDVVDVVFLTKLGKERVSKYLVYRRFKPCMK